MLSAIAGLLGFSVLAGVLVTALVTPALAVTSMTANSSIGVFEALPDYMEVGELAQKNTLYGKLNGEYVPFAEIFKQNREEVAWDQVSPFIKHAVVAGEDRRFYEHGGVDVQSIIRAALGNLSSNEIGSGASTLAMQLVKNINIQNALLLPTKEQRDAAIAAAQAQSLDRKLKEAKFAIGLEKNYTKNQILLAYLNIAGFGGNTYGIESAAQQYLSKSAADVSLVEAASLVAIVQLPNDQNLDDPKKYPANKVRRDFILKNMLDLKMITQAQYDEAVATPIEDYVKITAPSSGCTYASAAKTFCDYIRKSVKDLEMLGSTPDEREANWDRGGYKVYTTIDLDEQANAEGQLEAYAPRAENRFKLGGAVSSVQVGTGRILVMAQNKSFDDTGNGDPVQTTAVNFNTDKAYGGSSGFPAASTYKLFTLTDWLMNGHGLREVVNASPHDSRHFKADCVGGYVYNPPYHPANDAGEQGPWTVIRATARSVNGAFISMAEQLDLCDIRDVAESLGVHRADGNPLKTDASSILGVNEVAPLTMASAIATIGGGGVYCAPIAIDKIVDANGTDIGGQNSRCHQAISADIAAGAAYALKAVMDGGGTGYASNPRNGTPLIGKSGTDDQAWHTWVISSSTKVAMAVWVGNIEGHQSLRRINVAGTFGSLIRHRIGLGVLGPLTSEYGGSAFPSPPANLLSGTTLELPDLKGKTVEEAKALLLSLGLNYADGGTKASDAPTGSVAETDPAAGTKVSKGYQVTVFTSDGTLYVEMPDVITKSLHQANQDLVAAGFDSDKISVEWQPTANPGDPTCEVTASNPSPGTPTSKTAAVTLTVSALPDGSPPPGCMP
ncbi:transglycosylase domain-containing protein [Leifsonia bigeumensis]|uniref:Transglycosylase domain-containing protein n=1 Tax=Leifsonella bigeumensis TaxID=433643 RepID=A0ABP7FJF4_9MICO